MIGLFHINSEARGFRRHGVTKAAIISIILMPLLYSALYLWAFLDPLGKLDAVPVALVNSDKGAIVGGQSVRAGEQIVQGLHENGAINWIDTTADDARKGVASGRYYFSLELPENFSAAVTSPGNDGASPEKARLVSHYNDANGYISTVIGENVMREVLLAVGSKISAQAVDKVLLGVVDAGGGLTRASTGAKAIANGAGQLDEGLNKLSDGSNSLAAATTKLSDGLKRAKDGSNQLADGTQQLATRVDSAIAQVGPRVQNMPQMIQALDGFGADAARLQQNVTNFKNTTSVVTQAQARQAEELRRNAETLRGLKLPILEGMAANLSGLADRLENEGLGPKSPATQDIETLHRNTTQLSYQLNDPSSPVRTGAAQLATLPEQLDKLKNGVDRLNDGTKQLRDGITAASDGAVRIADGARQLRDGTVRASDGAKRLDAGANELSTRLSEGAQRVPRWNDADRLAKAGTIGGPLELTTQNDTGGKKTFSSGLAPFFFSMSLFIGGIMTFTLLKPLQARTVNSGVSALRAAWDGYLPKGLIGAAQGAIVAAVTMWVVRLPVDSHLGVLAFAMLVGMTWTAVNQACVALFGGGPGRVTALGFLMIQVVSAGGLYPVETQNKLIQWYHPINPMTYAVDGFRQVMYGYYDERIIIAIGVMFLVLAAALSATAFAAKRQRMWTMARLHPALPT